MFSHSLSIRTFFLLCLITMTLIALDGVFERDVGVFYCGRTVSASIEERNNPPPFIVEKFRNMKEKNGDYSCRSNGGELTLKIFSSNAFTLFSTDYIDFPDLNLPFPIRTLEPITLTYEVNGDSIIYLINNQVYESNSETLVIRFHGYGLFSPENNYVYYSTYHDKTITLDRNLFKDFVSDGPTQDTYYYYLPPKALGADDESVSAYYLAKDFDDCMLLILVENFKRISEDISLSTDSYRLSACDSIETFGSENVAVIDGNTLVFSRSGVYEVSILIGNYVTEYIFTVNLNHDGNIDKPEQPDIPDAPNTPEEPESPETPNAPDDPETPDIQDKPDRPNEPTSPDGEGESGEKTPSDDDSDKPWITDGEYKRKPDTLKIVLISVISALAASGAAAIGFVLIKVLKRGK